MRSGFCAAVALLLSACTSEPGAPPQDCATAKAQFWSCFERFQTTTDGDISMDFEAMWYACVPHSDPKEFKGSWAADFEWSRFYDSRQPTPQEAFADFDVPYLEFKEGAEAPPASENKARLWAMTFIGREETCRLFPDVEPTIFVEEVIDQKLVWEVQGYPTYTYEKSVP
jgi:hypothetical protein